MNGPLFRYTWRSQRIKLVLVSAGLTVWGFLMPFVYAKFGSRFKTLMASGILPKEFAQFGNGDVFSLPGSIALGFIHPIAISLTSVFAVGFCAAAVASEQQQGTLEVTLARPISRRSLYLTLLTASFGFVAVTIASLLVGSVLGSAFEGISGELSMRHLPLLWINGCLLFGSIGAIGLAASVSFDRFAPALGVTLGTLVVSYFLEILGFLWPDADFLQPYSLFHYLKPKSVLTGTAAPFDFAVLAAVIVAAVIWALVVFPRRDLAAPS